MLQKRKISVLFVIIISVALMNLPLQAFALDPASNTKDAAKGKEGQALFISNNGKYSSYDNLNHSLNVDPAYGYRLFKSNAFEVVPFGTVDNGTKTAALISNEREPDKFDLFRVPANSAGSFGVTLKNAYIRQPGEISATKIDIKLTVTSVKHILDPSVGLVGIANDSVTPGILTYGVEEVNVKYDYYHAGTTTPYQIKSNFTYYDIDDNQWVGVKTSAIVEQYLDANTNLSFGTENGYSVAYEAHNKLDFSASGKYAWGCTFKATELNIIFGNGNARDGQIGIAWFGQATREAMYPVDDDLPKPFKTVTDSDETDTVSNLLSNANERFTYNVYQDIPAASKGNYSSFIMADQIESCLAIDKVMVYDKHSSAAKSMKAEWVSGSGVTNSDWFNIAVSSDNKVTATVKSSILKSDDFYGGEGKHDSRKIMHIECHIKPTVSSATLRAHGHYTESDTMLAFKNTAAVTINDKTSVTNETITKVPVPDLVIEKIVNRYENRVGDTYHYTVNVKHSSKSGGDASNVRIWDTDIPAGVSLSNFTVTGVSAQVKSLVPDKDGKGFVFTCEVLKKGETAVIGFDAAADKTLNGTIIDNIAYVQAFADVGSGADKPKSDDASVYINSPKLKIVKSADIPELKPGASLTYEIELTQINAGTFMRDIVVEDEIATEGVKLHKGSVQVMDQDGKVLTSSCDIAFTKNGFKVTPHKDMAFDDGKIPPKEKGVAPYDKLSPITKLVITYDVSIPEKLTNIDELKNAAMSPGTPNTNGDKIPDDPDIPSGGDKTEVIIPRDSVPPPEIVVEREPPLKKQPHVVKKKTPDKKKKAKTPKTGDGFNMATVMLILGASGVILAGLLLLRRRFTKKLL